jgi:uncharacterized protein YndB with AHSA1/START domain
MTPAMGAVHAEGVRFERLYDATPAELWSALTDPEQIQGWLAHVARLDLEPEGEVELQMDAEGTDVVRGRIRAIEHERVLEFDWHASDAPASVVRLEIEPRDTGGTLLVLQHRALPGETIVDYGAGWHAHLDLLGALVTRTPRDLFWSRYRELRPAYEREAASLP